jgi:hypothetical protein
VDRILEHVLDGVDVLLLRLDQHGVEAAPEDVVSAAVAFVEGACVASVQVAHAARQVRLGRLDDQVVVVAHQAPRVETPAEAPLDPAQEVEEHESIGVVADDRGPVVSPGRDVVEGAGFENSARAGHVATVASRFLRPHRPYRGRRGFVTGASRARHGTSPNRTRKWPRGSPERRG